MSRYMQIHVYVQVHVYLSSVLCLVAQSGLTLCDPMNCSPLGSSVPGILQARILEWQPSPSPGNPPNLGIEPRSSGLQADSFPSEPPGKLTYNLSGFILRNWLIQLLRLEIQVRVDIAILNLRSAGCKLRQGFFYQSPEAEFLLLLEISVFGFKGVN